MGNRVYLSMVGGMLLIASNVTGQPTSSTQPSSNSQQIDRDIDMLRKDVRSQKKQIIAANLKLTDQEAQKFWPIYDRYTADLVEINNTKYALIKQYVQGGDTMTDAQWDKSVEEWLGLEESVAQLRVKYRPMFRAVLSAKNTALYFQMDRQLQMIIDLQLASMLPLVQP